MRKRYNITLNQEYMEAMQSLVKDFGQKPEMVGHILDDFMSQFLLSVAPMLRKAHAGEKVTVTDLFTFVGQQLEKITEEEKEQEIESKKTVEGGKARVKPRNQPRT